LPPPVLEIKSTRNKLFLTLNKEIFMDRVSRFVVWICSKFNREQIERIVTDLQDILKNRNPEIKPKDDFKEKHPNYRDFSVDPNPPLKEPLKKSQK
jgi:hypothetical protein